MNESMCLMRLPGICGRSTKMIKILMSEKSLGTFQTSKCVYFVYFGIILQNAEKTAGKATSGIFSHQWLLHLGKCSMYM